MGSAYLKVLDFDGLSMTGTEYEGCFLTEFDIASQFPLDAVMAEAPGDFPTFIRGDPQDRVIPLHVIIRNSTQTLIDGLKTVFSPSRDPVYLRVQDDNGNVRRMLVKSLGLTPWKGHDEESYVASLEAPEPVWEGDPTTSQQFGISGSAATGYPFGVTNVGNESAYVGLSLLAAAVKGKTNSFIDRWPIIIAWRSPLEGVDSQGLPYPLDITNDAWDTAALIVAGNLQADGDDVRVFVDGEEVDRYLDGLNTTGTSVWCSIAFQPMASATVANMPSGVDPANGGSLVVTNEQGTSGFPQSGALLVQSECITYGGKLQDRFLNIRRGMRGTTAAAHTAGQTAYWVEHEIVLVSNYSAYASPLARADVKPILNLAASNNSRHTYGTTDGFLDPDSLRTGQWLRELRQDSLAAPITKLYQAAGIITVEDALPSAGQPNFDSLTLYAPCFISPSITGVALDYEVDHDMLLEIYGADSEGFESLLLRRDVRGEGIADTYYVGAAAYENAVTLLPAQRLGRLTFHGRTYRLTGAVLNTDPFALTAGSADEEAEGWVLQDSADVWAISSFIAKVAGSTRDARMRLYPLDASGPTSQQLVLERTVAPADIPDLPTIERITVFLSEIINLAAGSYVTAWRNGAGAGGNVAVYGRTVGPFYPTQTRWDETATVWVQQVADDISNFVLGPAGPQNDASLGLGTTVRWRNVTVHLDSAYIPAIVMAPRQDGYLLSSRLENQTTGQVLTFLYPLPLNGRVKADTDLHIVTTQDSAAALDDENQVALEPAGYEDATGAWLEDLANWLLLAPGLNALLYTEADIGSGRLTLDVLFRPRWT